MCVMMDDRNFVHQVLCWLLKVQIFIFLTDKEEARFFYCIQVALQLKALFVQCFFRFSSNFNLNFCFVMFKITNEDFFFKLN